MTLVIPPGFAEASAQLRNSGDPQPWYVTFGIDVSDIGGQYGLAAAHIYTVFQESWLSQMTAATSLDNITLRIGQDGGEPLVVISPGGSTGVGSSAKLPQNCALLIRKTSARGGRSGKGRMFMPNVLPESAVDNVGVIENATVAAFQDVADQFFNDLAGEGGAGPTPMVLLHNEGISGSTVPTPVTAFQVDNVIATQRRRLRR